MTKIAIVGSGLIGRAWATVFASHGFDVALQDVAPGAAEAARTHIATNLRELAEHGLVDDPKGSLARIRVASGLADALAGADFVQENGPETVEAKRALFAEMDALATPEAILSSSTSFIMASVFSGRGQIAGVIVSKRDMPHRFDGEVATRFVADGAAPIDGQAEDAELQIVSVGAYQLEEALKAAHRLKEHGRRILVTAINEPGRFRIPRDPIEARFVAKDDALARLFPVGLPRLIVSHTRPELMLGLLRRLDGGPKHTAARGYISRGGTLDVAGMLFANRCSWAHLVEAASALAGWSRDVFLTVAERNAIDGKGTPADLVTQRY